MFELVAIQKWLKFLFFFDFYTRNESLVDAPSKRLRSLNDEELGSNLMSHLIGLKCVG